jgi:two-component system, NtrC family, sensor kinase
VDENQGQDEVAVQEPQSAVVGVSFLDELPLGLLVVRAGKVVWVNRYFAGLIDYSSKDILGNTLDEAMPGSLLRFWMESPCSREVDGKQVSRTLIWRRSEQETLQLSVTRIPLDAKDQSAFGLVFQDTSELREAERARSEEHQLLRTVIDMLPSFIYAKDTEGRFIMANQVTASFMGCSDPRELIGKTDFDQLPYHFAMKYYCDEQEVLCSGRPKVNLVESFGATEKSEPIWLNTTKVPFRNSEGAIVGIVGAGIDITRQKKTNDQLFELQEIVNHSSTCAFLISSYDNWMVRFCTENVANFGYLPSDFHENGLNFLEIVHPDDLISVQSSMKESFSSGIEDFRQEYRIRFKSGEYRWVEDHKHLRKHLDDGEYLFQSLLTDVTVRHQIQEEKDLMEIQLRQALKLEAVGQLAAGVAHEINTPIQFISDNLQFLSESMAEIAPLLLEIRGLVASRVIPEEMRTRFEAVDLPFLLEEIPLAVEQSREGAKRVRDIVMAMKEFSHPGSGRISDEDINRAIENTVTVARNEWKYVADVVLDLDPQMSLVPADIGPIKQCLLNLIINAAHAIQDKVKKQGLTKGKITIRSRRIDDCAQIEVEDTGSGMPESVARRVFDPFFTTKEVGKGTGQGLTMAYDIIVRKHKGKLHFRTHDGVGTTFIIELPMNGPKSSADLIG